MRISARGRAAIEGSDQLSSQVAVLLASFVATSEVEQAFSFVEMYSAKRKHSTLPEHLRPAMHAYRL